MPASGSAAERAWKTEHFHKTFDEAYRQLYQYRDDLDNPPLSVVCDIRIHPVSSRSLAAPGRPRKARSRRATTSRLFVSHSQMIR